MSVLQKLVRDLMYSLRHQHSDSRPRFPQVARDEERGHAASMRFYAAGTDANAHSCFSLPMCSKCALKRLIRWSIYTSPARNGSQAKTPQPGQLKP